jgi:alanyl-tRNA synthetase
MDPLRRLARQIADLGGVALLGLSGPKAQLIFARAAGLPYDMGALLRQAVSVIGGRGGGRADAAQGGGPDGARLPEALEHARQLLLASETA